MPEYIEREAAYELARTNEYYSDFRRSMADLTSLKELLEDVPTSDVVEVVRCKNCCFAYPLDKHCEINSSTYRHCSLLRGDLTRNVWHKYYKYYKNYSIVELDEYCSEGKRKEGAANDL